VDLVAVRRWFTVHYGLRRNVPGSADADARRDLLATLGDLRVSQP
jgi:hypothetical protein